jgi:uroporphyrinogen-III synthase
MTNISIDSQTNLSVRRKRVLFTQPRPEGPMQSYHSLAEKFQLDLFFHPFITIEPISALQFRKQKIAIDDYQTVLFVSRNAIEHYFRIRSELRLKNNENMQYVCLSAAVAQYLNKYIVYRKRKIFYSEDGTNESLFQILEKVGEDDKSLLYVCSENQQDNDIIQWLTKEQYAHSLAFMYKSISNDLAPIMQAAPYDIICFFTPSGVKSMFDYDPTFHQNGTVLGAFGSNTYRALNLAGLEPAIIAPSLHTPNMVVALENYLTSLMTFE